MVNKEQKITLSITGSRYRGKWQLMSKTKESAYQITAFTDLKQCIHYCPTAGHLWVHDPGRTDGFSRYEWRISDTSSLSPNKGSIKFFSTCPAHRRRYDTETREEGY